MSLESELAGRLPVIDPLCGDPLWMAARLDPVSGDHMRLVPRDGIFRVLWELIRPLSDALFVTEPTPDGEAHPDGMGCSPHEEVAAGRRRMVADIWTEEGRARWLECWWPSGMDAACLAWNAAPGGREAALPFPAHTMLRTAVVLVRTAKDTVVSTMRLGAVTETTTTAIRAYHDIGIRRMIWYPSQELVQWFTAPYAPAKRLIELPPDSPESSWRFSPLMSTPRPAPLTMLAPLDWYPESDTLIYWLQGAA